jgi:hypothetical protein
MKPLFTQEEFNSAKSNDTLPCKCYHCNNIFFITKHKIQDGLNPNLSRECKYCSRECQGLSNNKSKIVICNNCDKEFLKKRKDILKTPNHFCSKSCSATYNNKHKKHGNRRSKLEIWLEQQLTLLYPKLVIEFNQSTAIGSELDIYIPSLNLAFELNGIFHYEPIYGTNKLDQIQNNDISKSLACHDAKIDLCVIDTCSQKYFKESTSKEFLNIIEDIINKRF